MDIKFRCKNCGQKHGVSEELAIEMAGQTIDCSRCGTAMLVPPVFAIPQDMTSTVTVTKTISRSMPVADILSFTDKLEHGRHHADRTKAPAKNTPTIFFTCKSCGLKYRLGAEYAGMIAQCSHCHTEMNIPQASEPYVSTSAPEKTIPSPPPVQKPATTPATSPNKLIQHSPAGLLNKNITPAPETSRPALPSLKPLSPQVNPGPSHLKPLSPQMLPPRTDSAPATPRLSSLPPQVLSPLRKPVPPVVKAKPDTPSDDDMPKLTFNKKN